MRDPKVHWPPTDASQAAPLAWLESSTASPISAAVLAALVELFVSPAASGMPMLQRCLDFAT
jgi:hypothetical protein